MRDTEREKETERERDPERKRLSNILTRMVSTARSKN